MAKEEVTVKPYNSGGWRAHYILIICFLLYVINYADRQIFAAVLQLMKNDLNLTDAECGLLQTIFLVGISLFAFPAGHLIDRWSRKKSIAAMAVIWSASTYVTGLAKSFTGVLLPRAIVGIGEAGFTAGGTALIGAAYPNAYRGRVFGIFNTAIIVGIALGTILGGAIATKYGWRAPFLYFAIPGVILGILALFIKDYTTTASPTASNGKSDFLGSIVALYNIPSLKWFFLGYGILNFTSTSFLVWTPAYAMRTMNWSAAQASLVVGIATLVCILGPPIGGFIGDYWQKKNPRGRVLLACVAAVIGTILLLLLTFLKFTIPGIAIFTLWGTINIMILPILAAVSQDVVPASHKGLSFGLAAAAAYLLGGAWGPVVTGKLSDAFGGGADGLTYALAITCIGGFIGAFFMYLASRHYAEDTEKVKGEQVVMGA